MDACVRGHICEWAVANVTAFFAMLRKICGWKTQMQGLTRAATSTLYWFRTFVNIVHMQVLSSCKVTKSTTASWKWQKSALSHSQQGMLWGYYCELVTDIFWTRKIPRMKRSVFARFFHWCEIFLTSNSRQTQVHTSLRWRNRQILRRRLVTLLHSKICA